MVNWICDELWDNILIWDYNIVIEIEYKCKVEHVLICNIHVKCDDRFWHCEILNCGHDVWLWISVWLALDVTITCVLWVMNYTITRPVFTLRKVFYAWGVKSKV